MPAAASRRRPATEQTASRSHTPARGRLAWLDVARGLALLSMFVAHTAPSAGPGGVLNLSEFATAALFAALIGASAHLETRAYGAGRAFAAALIRAAALVGCAWVNSLFGAQVVDVLAHLAVVTVVMSLLAWLPTAPLAVAGACAGGVGIWLTHLGMAALVPQVVTPLVGHGADAMTLYRMLAEGFVLGPYRVPFLLAWACLGAVLLRLLQARPQAGAPSASRAPWRRGAAVVGVGAAVLAASLLGGHRALGAFPEPYAGSVWELLIAAGLVAGVFGVCALVVPLLPGPAVRLLAIPGAMTLSVYVAHQAYLGWAVRDGAGPWLNARGTDDSWFNVAVLCLGGILLPLAWRALVRAEPFRRGPIEGLVRLPTTPLHRRAGGTR